MPASPTRKLVRRLHLWLGLSLGGLFVLLGLTGSLLVFYTEIDQLLHPEIRVEQRVAPDWNNALQTVRTAFPDKGGAWRFEVRSDGGAIPARYYNPPETAGRDFAPMMVWLSPDGRKVLRRDYWGDYAMTFIYDLHYRLLLGKTGGVVLGYAGIALSLLLLSGLWAWWPKGSWRKALHYKSGAVQSRKLRDQHKLAGLVGLPLLLVLSVTGVMLELPQESDAVLGAAIGPVDDLPDPVSRRSEGKQITPDEAVASAQASLPNARIAWIEVPAAGDGAFRIRVQQPSDPSARFPHSFVWIDQHDGSVLAVTDAQKAGASTTINNWLHPLHDGSIGGLSTRILTAFSGLFPLFLFWSGFRRWRIRRWK